MKSTAIAVAEQAIASAEYWMARVEELKKDSLRLDWVDRNWMDFEGICARSETKDIREMIDREMERESR